jgi:hypothetical protein
MAARTFTDAAGRTWEVFEVHRASQKAGAVSPGLENGWLAFASGENKRRLAPIPAGWALATETELQALCESARHAPKPRYPLDRPVRPRIRRTTTEDARGRVNDSAEQADLAAPAASAEPRTPASDVEHTVRSFAHDARGRKLPVVTAMLELKALLRLNHPELDFENRDRQVVRRWFVDTYYFQRNA